MKLSDRLRELDVELPEAAAVGAYVPTTRVGNLIFVSGQLPMKDGQLLATGPVPSRCEIEKAQQAARQCVINALGAIRAADGTVDHLQRVIRVGVFVASDSDFTRQPLVANGASGFLIELFGDAGRHVRAAVGTNVLPLDASVEVEFLFEAAPR